MCILRPDGTIELTNEAFQKILGAVPGDATSFLAAVHDDDRESTGRALRRAFSVANERIRFTHRYRASGGGFRLIEWRGRGHADSERLYLLGEDITAARKTENMLRESRQNLQALVEFAAQGILTVDESGSILTANPMAAGIFGYEQDELIGLSVDALLPESLRRAHEHHRAGYAKAPSPREMGRGRDLEGKRKDGSPVPVEISLSHFEGDNGLVVVALVSDITERRRAQSETRQLERRLEHATKMEAIGRLAGGIAHDFNNLLTALSGFAEIVLDELPENHPLCEGAREVKRTCGRSVSMVRRLLSASRQQPSEPSVLDVGAKVNEFARMLRGLLGENVQLDVEVDPASPRAKLDEGQLEQVLLNLVVNAKDALPARGRIGVAVRPQTNDDDRYVELEFADDGHGMPPEHLARIFEPFFTTRQQGTGLGLAMVKSIVERSGGRIHVESEPAKGTTFRILFPEHRGDDDEVNPEAVSDARPPAQGSETILVAEAENSVRLVTTASLRRVGYRVIEARDGEEALRLGVEHEGSLDLVLTDVVMPRASGPELVRRLRRKHPRVRALYMSGLPREALTEHGISHADGSFIEKPFSRETLTRFVRHALDALQPDG